MVPLASRVSIFRVVSSPRSGVVYLRSNWVSLCAVPANVNPTCCFRPSHPFCRPRMRAPRRKVLVPVLYPTAHPILVACTCKRRSPNCRKLNSGPLKVGVVWEDVWSAVWGNGNVELRRFLGFLPYCVSVCVCVWECWAPRSWRRVNYVACF